MAKSGRQLDMHVRTFVVRISLAARCSGQERQQALHWLIARLGAGRGQSVCMPLLVHPLSLYI